jgi:hypothetical protein
MGTGAALGENSTVIGSGTTTGDFSIAEGAGTTAGCKGYYISYVDPTNRYIYLETEEISPQWVTQETPANHITTSENPYDVGMEFSISASGYYHWVKAGEITEINGNRIQYSETNRLDGTQKWQEKTLTGGTDVTPFILFVPSHPEIGTAILGYGAKAEGYNTKALTNYSHAEGYYTQVIGQYGHAEGNGAIAGFAAHAEGEDTQALGITAHAEGY